PARDVAPLGALGDEPLPARPARPLEPSLRVAAPRFAQLQSSAWPDRILEARTALEERPASEIVSVELQQVKYAEDNGICRYQVYRCVRDSQALLEPAERRLRPIERDHLAVEQNLTALLARNRCAHLGVRIGELLGRA